MLKDIEKSKNPKTQLKKANTSLEKVINLQKYQQSQILSENDECTKVSKILSLPRTIIPANQTSIESIIKGASPAQEIDSVNTNNKLESNVTSSTQELNSVSWENNIHKKIMKQLTTR